MDSELHYVSYDPEAILQQMYTTYIECGGSGIYPGDEKSILLQGVLQMFVQAFAGIDNALRMGTLRYAVGEYLDLKGEDRGYERIAATEATATLTLTFTAEAEAGAVVPVGTAFTADGKILWMTDEDITLTGGAEVITVPVTCSMAGSIGNSLTSGTAMQALTDIPGLGNAVSATAGSGGLEEEDDEAYRERIRIGGVSTVTTGTAQQYEAAAMAVSSVIIDAKAIQSSYQGYTVIMYLLAEDQDDLTDLVSVVKAELSDRNTRSLTDAIYVYKAIVKEYTLNVKYSCEESSGAHEKIAEAVAEYKKWQEGKIGRPFNPDRLMSMMYQAGASRVIWDDGCAFDDGDAEYTEIPENMCCKGTITTAVITT